MMFLPDNFMVLVTIARLQNLRAIHRARLENVAFSPLPIIIPVTVFHVPASVKKSKSVRSGPTVEHEPHAIA